MGYEHADRDAGDRRGDADQNRLEHRADDVAAADPGAADAERDQQ